MEPIRIIVVRGLGNNISAVLTNQPGVEVLIENPEVYKCTSTVVKTGSDKKCLYQTLVKCDPRVVNDFHAAFNAIHPSPQPLTSPPSNGNVDSRNVAERP